MTQPHMHESIGVNKNRIDTYIIAISWAAMNSCAQIIIKYIKVTKMWNILSEEWKIAWNENKNYDYNMKII